MVCCNLITRTIGVSRMKYTVKTSHRSVNSTQQNQFIHTLADLLHVFIFNVASVHRKAPQRLNARYLRARNYTASNIVGATVRLSFVDAGEAEGVEFGDRNTVTEVIPNGVQVGRADVCDRDIQVYELWEA